MAEENGGGGEGVRKCGNGRKTKMLNNIVKRDGTVVAYNRERIESAVFRVAVSNKVESPNENKFRVYIECLGQFRDLEGNFLRWSDNRLLRRMSRDSISRNMDIRATLTHWHYVRKSELQYIIPYIHEADAIINTALTYEFAFWKRYLFDELEGLKLLYVDEPKRLDAHIRVNRVYNFLKCVEPVGEDVVVPEGALIREFIGE